MPIEFSPGDSRATRATTGTDGGEAVNHTQGYPVECPILDGIPNDQVKIGMAVKAKIIRENDRAMVVFEPA